jgi:hypothetical protein
LRRLRERYAHELVVIGVHSAKFPSERATANIRQAIARHAIEHPVVNDADFAIWNQYAVRAWPTLVLVDPAGKVVGVQPGEIQAEDFYPIVDETVAAFGARGQLDRNPLPQLAPAAKDPAAPLRFPTKLLHAAGDRLFIADSGHHRILEVQLELTGRSGVIVRSFGTGEPGWADGSIRAASFHSPHGLALQGRLLYVADTGNHCVRAIDLVYEQVTTLAGAGRMGRGLSRGRSAPLATALRSPWDLTLADEVLLIAMAGSHQIWGLVEGRAPDEPSTLGVLAGTGAEALLDGPLQQAAFNQPSGLTFNDGVIYVADAEASAIRAIYLEISPGEGAANRVQTLVGAGLFDFGDVDGMGDAVRLQHPTGIAYDRTVNNSSILYIADSYNHKIKRLDLATRAVQTVAGTGQPGLVDGPASQGQLYEPDGLAVAGSRLYIADTNNHAIRLLDLESNRLSTVRLD